MAEPKSPENHPQPVKSAGRKSYICAKCGACSSVCPVYRETGRESHTARGKLHLLSQTVASPQSNERSVAFSKCLNCGACQSVCPRDIDVPSLVAWARGGMPPPAGAASIKKQIAQKILAHPALTGFVAKVSAGLRLIPGPLPEDSGLRFKIGPAESTLLAKRSPETVPPKREHNDSVLYFSGCLATYLYPDIAESADRLLNRLCNLGSITPSGQNCCGLAAQSAGDFALARDLAQKTIRIFSADRFRSMPIFTSCSSCYTALRGYGDLFAEDSQWAEIARDFSSRVQEFSSYLLQQGKLNGALSTPAGINPVFYHDPCHLRFGLAGSRSAFNPITQQPRQLLAHVPGLTLTELPSGPQCCGQGGLFHLAHPDIARNINNRLLDSFAATEAALSLTTCSGCLLHWKQGLKRTGSSASCLHLAQFLAACLK